MGHAERRDSDRALSSSVYSDRPPSSRGFTDRERSSGVHRTVRRSVHSSFPARIPPSLTAATVPPVATLNVLEAVEKLDAKGCGALVYAESGVILVEEGNICWAASRSLGRLTDLLRRQADPPLPKERIEEVVRRCKREGTPLGESLVAEGIVNEDTLHRALRQHIAEAVAALSLSQIKPTYVERQSSGYDARFTFSTPEILASVGALALPELASKARKWLHELDDLGSDCTAAFHSTSEDGPLRPIGQKGFEDRPARDLHETCRVAAHLLRVPTWADAQVLYLGAGDGLMLAWKSGPIAYVGWCSDRAVGARLVSALRQRGVG